MKAASDEGTEPDKNLGRVLAGNYRLESLLGEGGMGSVYRGVQLSVQRPVAVKLIASAVANNPEVIRRFRREAEAMAKLRHPNSVRLFDFGVTDDGELFMVMELLEGCDLAQRLQRGGALPLGEALRLAKQALEALSEAHALGIVHRDLKPANVFLCQVEGQGGQALAKVMDFGIAGIEQDGNNTKLTMAGALLGTPAYMSPEQAQGNPVDFRSDLYSLGVMLFEMVTGSTPFVADSMVQLLLAQVSKQPPRLSEARPDLPELAGLQPLLDRLLAKTQATRPGTAASVVEDIDALLRGLEQPARPRATPVISPTQARLQAAVRAARASGPPPAALMAPTPLRGTLLPGLQGRGRAIAAGAAALVTLLAVVSLWPGGDAPLEQPASALAEAAADQPEASEADPRGPVAPQAPGGGGGGGGAPSPSDAQQPESGDRDLAEVDEVEPAPALEESLREWFGGTSTRERREALLRRGPAYPDVASAKRAYRARQIDRQGYADTIWVLKTLRKQRIYALKAQLRAGRISRAEYKQEARRIDAEYEGR